VEILVGVPEFLLFNTYHNQSFSNGADSAALGVGFRPLPQTTPMSRYVHLRKKTLFTELCANFGEPGRPRLSFSPRLSGPKSPLFGCPQKPKYPRRTSATSRIRAGLTWPSRSAWRTSIVASLHGRTTDGAGRPDFA
jgi:hypothetical protein